MSIKKVQYKKKNGSISVKYRAIVTVRGSRKQISKTFTRKIDALAWERKAKDKYVDQSEEMLDWSRRSLGEFAERWLRDYAIVQKTNGSVIRDKQLLKNQILPYLGQLKLNSVSTVNAQQWLASLSSDQKLSPKSICNCLGLLNKILNDAVAWKLLANNQVATVKGPPVLELEMLFWNKGEMIEFLDFVHGNNFNHYVVFLMALMTGMRKGELRALRWKHINWNELEITVVDSYCEKTNTVQKHTKSKRIRKIPINARLLTILMGLKARLDSQEFQNSFILNDFDWRHTHRAMDYYCAASNVTRIRFHDLRHTFASQLIMNGVNMFVVQKLLGHSSIKTTQRYIHLSPEFLKNSTDCLDDAIKVDTAPRISTEPTDGLRLVTES